MNRELIPHLKDIVTRRNISDVNPLAIYVSGIGVMAPRAQTLQDIESSVLYYICVLDYISLFMLVYIWLCLCAVCGLTCVWAVQA